MNLFAPFYVADKFCMVQDIVTAVCQALCVAIRRDCNIEEKTTRKQKHWEGFGMKVI